MCLTKLVAEIPYLLMRYVAVRIYFFLYSTLGQAQTLWLVSLRTPWLCSQVVHPFHVLMYRSTHYEITLTVPRKSCGNNIKMHCPMVNYSHVSLLNLALFETFQICSWHIFSCARRRSRTALRQAFITFFGNIFYRCCKSILFDNCLYNCLRPA